MRALKNIFVKASVAALLLILGIALFFVTYICVNILLFSKPTGFAQIFERLIWIVTAVFFLLTLCFLHFAFGLLFKKLSNSNRILLSIFLLWLALVIFVNLFLPQYHRCDLYTDVMNGGIRTFNGASYNIVICGLNGIIQPENFQHDEVRLRVFSMEGELLAERYFSPELAMGSPITPLEYEKDHLVYYTENQLDASKRLAMPPTRLDWIRARLPRMWP